LNIEARDLYENNDDYNVYEKKNKKESKGTQCHWPVEKLRDRRKQEVT
jgi:hypothetical protein